jgi:hypothetical protein
VMWRELLPPACAWAIFYIAQARHQVQIID